MGSGPLRQHSMTTVACSSTLLWGCMIHPCFQHLHSAPDQPSAGVGATDQLLSVDSMKNPSLTFNKVELCKFLLCEGCYVFGILK
jgi:hypothetical protein